ncbi:MAG: 50S ribosomal protein L11 methyltransferase [Solirubrobacterales bacterium]
MIRLAVRVRREDAELVLAELLELAPSGVEETEVGEGLVEYVVYGSPGELPQLPDLRAAAGEALVEIATSELPDDWSERWKRFHRPVLIEGSIVPSLHVRPPWEASSDRVGIEEIVIDPGQAFGTGAHATTRLCLELLLALAADERRRGPLLDVGTGSGVLAIAAARLGFAPVIGLDHELESVEAARENAEVNGVEMEVRSFDLRRERLPAVDGVGETTVLANLLRPLLLDLSQSVESIPANLIVGGLLVEEVDEVLGAFGTRLGLGVRERRTSGEWGAAWLQSGA